EKRRTNSCRSEICAFAFAMFGSLSQVLPDATYTPLWPHLGLSGAFFLLFVFSSWFTRFEPFLWSLLYGFFALVFLWVLFFTYANDFALSHTIQLVVVILTLDLAIFVPRHLVAFALFSTVTTAAALLLSDTPGMIQALFISLIAFGHMINYISTSHKYQAHRETAVSRERAEEANRMKDLFIAKTSHDLRSPLNGIIGFTQMLMADEKNPERLKMHQAVLQSSEMLLRLINDLLDLSKISAGTLHIEYRPFSPRELVETIGGGCRALTASRGIDLSVTVTDRVPQFLVSDRLRIGQILLNLLSNAIKFTDRGSIRVTIDLLTTTQGHPRMWLRVADTGIGIPQDQVPRIFESFVQITEDDDKRRQGLGLGLSIVKSLVDMLGGTITVESVLGAGSTFSVELPVSGVEEALTETVTAP
ncbi:MAG TPA: HAMP domain-containing sensor histidine kinase, partial [bacterium]|nr:HAMP domain-containing sensor histidine kinase [bacterium]